METQLKYYNALGIPQLLHRSGTWIRKAKHVFRLQGAEIKFLSAVKGSTRRDLIRNDRIGMALGLSLIHI